MRRAAFVVVAVMAFVRVVVADPAPQLPPMPPGTDAERLAQQCDQGDALSCTVLGNALQDASPTVSGARRDLVAATAYWLKGCEIGNPSSCDSAGEAFLHGKGVTADDRTAARLLGQACDTDGPTNLMQGFACADEAEALLGVDYVANYEVAMSDLDKACSIQPSTCSIRAVYRGTGVLSDDTPPSGAVGFNFGDPIGAIETACRKGGGRASRAATGDTITCNGYFIDALNLKSRWVALTLCQKRLCGVNVVVGTEDDTTTRYLGLKKTLTEHYGTPAKITFELPQKCKLDAAFYACIEDGTAKFRSFWAWSGGELLTLEIASYKGSHAVLVSYGSPALTKRLSTSGL